MICDGCTEAAHGNFFHRCRANESSCVDGEDCPDYIEHCDCTLSTCNNEEEVEFIGVRA